MKKGKLFLIISAVVCTVLAGVVMLVAFANPEHKHVFADSMTGARIYHVTNNNVYFTTLCDCGEEKRYETNITFEEALVSLGEKDSLVLDEDITLTNEISLKSFAIKEDIPVPVNLDVRLNLNGHKISSDVEESLYNSMFMLNANYGKLSVSISNGSIYSEDLSYLFRFMNRDDSNNGIKLTLNNVECKVVGSQATPIFAHNESSKILVEANNSKFISQKGEDSIDEYGVGAFINSKSEFNFNNCYFEGGDAIYVKEGTVNLIGCQLANSGLAYTTEKTTDKFKAIGTCLATETYTTTQGSTKFNITITDCEMIGKNTTIMMYVAQTGEDGVTKGVNSESSIDVVSCTFTNDPISTIPNYGIINYVNGTNLQIDNEIWIAE